MKERVLAWGHDPREITIQGASVGLTYRYAITGDSETGDCGVSMETNLCGHTFVARQRQDKSETLEGLAKVVDDTILSYVSDNLDEFADVLMGADGPVIPDDIEEYEEFEEFCDQFGLYDFDPDTGEYIDKEEEDVLHGGFYEDDEYNDDDEDFGHYSEEEWK